MYAADFTGRFCTLRYANSTRLGREIRMTTVRLSFCRPVDEHGRTVVEKSQHTRRVLPFVFNFEFPAFRDVLCAKYRI